MTSLFFFENDAYLNILAQSQNIMKPALKSCILRRAVWFFFLSAALTAQSIPELHFRFIDSCMQWSMVPYLVQKLILVNSFWTQSNSENQFFLPWSLPKILPNCALRWDGSNQKDKHTLFYKMAHFCICFQWDILKIPTNLNSFYTFLGNPTF